MTPRTETLMFQEAAEASAAVTRQLKANRAIVETIAERLRMAPPRAVITCARGSSDHAATYFKHLVETRARVLVSSAMPSTASLYGATPEARGTLSIALSQSGRSPDLITTMTALAAAGSHTLAMVNDVGSPLAGLVDEVMPLAAGPERSVAATKSYIALLAAALSLVSAWTQDTQLASAVDELPAKLASAWTSDWSALVDALVDARSLYVIGRGPGFGIAQEAALKFKETCGLQAEAFSSAEVRHGPMALIGPNLPLLVFRQDDAAAAGIDTLIDAALARDAKVFVASDAPVVPGAIRLPVPAADPVVTPILAIQAFYRAANALSVRRGLDPDHPPSLRKVTETV